MVKGKVFVHSWDTATHCVSVYVNPCSLAWLPSMAHERAELTFPGH